MNQLKRSAVFQGRKDLTRCSSYLHVLYKMKTFLHVASAKKIPDFVARHAS